MVWIYLVPASSENIATSIDYALPAGALSPYLSKAEIDEIAARGGGHPLLGDDRRKTERI